MASHPVITADQDRSFGTRPLMAPPVHHPSEPSREKSMAQKRLRYGGSGAPDGVWIAAAYIDLAEAGGRFVAHRMRQHVCLIHEILRCREPAKVHSIYAAFVQNAIKDYQVGAVRMNKILQKIAREMLGDNHDDTVRLLGALAGGPSFLKGSGPILETSDPEAAKSRRNPPEQPRLLRLTAAADSGP